MAVPDSTAQLIERRIYLIRGQKVMLDSDLAELYEVPTKRLNEAVKRNADRFPEDFMFQLAGEEAEQMNRSQIATGSQKHRDPRFPPYAFTELGVAMLSSVLNSHRAVQMNILIMRAFVRLREVLAANTELARTGQKQHSRALQEHASILVSVVQDIQKLKHPPTTRAIGFVVRSPKRK
ncbi:MAG: ORF6N domain-containing protein [Bryobacteraceae bacterium]|jgi:hypothetical protein